MTMPVPTLSAPSVLSFPVLGVCDSILLGVLWLDERLRVQAHNNAFRSMLDLVDNDDGFVGRPYAEMLDVLHSRGEFREGDSEETLVDGLTRISPGSRIGLQRVRPNGMALSITARALPESGYALVYSDVSEERRLHEAIRRNNKASVVAMANLAEHRDADTGIHVLRVARLVGQTARKLMALPAYSGMIDEAFIEHVATASILHDVGKIATPDQILLKTGPLTGEEREVVKQHSVLGAQLLRQAKLTMGENPFLDMGAEIALTHHEWFNGNGYPYGLSGDEISLPGRICAVADVFDALTSERPYKAPWSMDKAVALIREQGGTQFDPDVVRAFVSVLEERERVCIVRWSNAMSVGHARIDDQHRILIDTINQLASADSLYNQFAVSMILDELLSYAAFHFEFEERLMAHAGYPQLEAHRREHQGFVNWINEYRDEYVKFGKRALGEPVLAFLKDWLSHHILEEDRRYCEFFRDRAK